MHCSSHYKRKISILENEVSRLESRVCEEQAINAELFKRQKNLERDFRSCMEEVKQLREETFSLEENQSGKGADSQEEPEVQCFCLKLSALLKKAIGMSGSEDNLYSYSEAGIENQRANHGNMPSSGTASCGSIFAEYFPYKKEDCLFQ